MGSSEHLSKGQLVRFLERTTRWYCARLRRVRDEDVDVTLFGGRSFRVPRNQVERIDAFFNGRERVWSVERARLTAFFYGREIERLHAGRLLEMQRALSKAGIVFRRCGPRQTRGFDFGRTRALLRGMAPSQAGRPR